VTVAGERLRVALAVPALVAIFLLGQGLLDQRPVRLDLTPTRSYTLSDQAERILDALPADVRIVAFLRSQDPRNANIRDLLRRVATRSARVTVDVVDVNRSPAMAREYGVGSYGAIVVESGSRRRSFSNPHEEVLMAALLQVTRQQRKVVGVVGGHGEGDFGDSERHRGWLTARTLLEQEFYDVRPVSLLGDEVPLETSVLLIAGPQKDFLPEELAALGRYLQRPGQALVLLDPLRAPELAAFLRRYGVEFLDDVVIDPDSRLYGGEVLTMRIAIERGAHPILGPLDAPVLFSLTRSVSPAGPGSEGEVAVEFLRTGEQSWATTDTSVTRTGSAVFVPGRDRRGPITVGLEVAFRTVTPPGAEPRQGRLVVYGNSDFANNFFIEYLGNKDLFVNSVDWLAREPDVISHRPRHQELGLQQFYVSAEQGDAVFWGAAVIEPAIFLALGLGVAMWRRRS
jgi:ABC-type uncharacterized transport system involved in gliding motility auxiliary subunit